MQDERNPEHTGSGPLGILAGGGALPLDIAAAAIAARRTPHIVAIEGFADPAIAAHSHTWVSLGQVGAMLASLREAGCREMVIAGSLRRPDLWRLRFDWGAVRSIKTLLSLTHGGDDSLLRRVIRFFESEGFVVRGVPDVAPHLLADAGAMGRHAPGATSRQAIAHASRLIDALGPFDVGQAAVATASGIIAIEGVRGTDGLLHDLGPGGIGAGVAEGGVLVKRTKPGQELRVDLPTVGPLTVAGAKMAGLSGIAISAGRSIVLGRREMIAAADRDGIFVHGMHGAEPAVHVQAETREPSLAALAVASRRAPTPAERRDIAVARRLIPVLREHGGGRAAVIAREHVLALAGALPIDGMIAGLGRNSRQWGRLSPLKKRVGLLALDIAGSDGKAEPSALPDLRIFKAVLERGLAGITCLGAPIPPARLADIVAWANEAHVFLMVEPPLPAL